MPKKAARKSHTKASPPPPAPTSALPPPVPSVDISAPLNIDTATVEKTEIPPLEKENSRLFRIGTGITAVIIIAAIIVTIYATRRPSSTDQATVPTATPIPSPTSDPRPAQRAQWPLEIQHTQALATKAKNSAGQLQLKGYTITKVSLTRLRLKENALYISKNATTPTEILLNDLGESYGISTISGVFSDSTAAARLVIVKD